MTANPPSSGIWQSAPRVEDEQLLRGQARFLDDVPVDDACHACFVRSAQAHARIVSIDTQRARAVPGVVGVYVKQDLFGELTSWRMPLGFALAALPENTTPFVLVDHEVAFVGEAIAVVVASSRHVAEDAASLVHVSYESLPVVADCREAVRPESPPVRTELSSNILQHYVMAYGPADEEFAQPQVLISEDFWVHRGAGHPMEGRGVLAKVEKSTDTLMVWSSTQMAHELHYTLALMLGQPEERLRVITPEVGGGFGAKFMIYPEEVVIPALARKLGRAVKWVEDRREHFISAVQERDQYWSVQLAADLEGKIRGLRGTMIHDHGAYTPQGTNVPYNAASSISGPYILPAYHLDVSVVHTNKVPVATIRGAGYPQAAFVMERLMDRLARELGIDPVECRRRNLIPADKIPYVKPLKSRAGLALTIDSGDFPALQARAVEAADLPGFAARRQASESRGRLRGWAIANSVKPTGRGPYESVRLKIQPSGTVAIYTGALAMGQGLKTTLAQLCAPHFGLGPQAIEVLAGDTAMIGYGHGGFASRQAIMAGNAASQAARNLRDKVLKVAAAVLGLEISVLRLSQGEVLSLDGAHRVSLARLSMLMKGVPGYVLPMVDDPGLEETVHFQCDAQTYAGACHVCEVEVDPEIGHIEVQRYLAVQDSGNIINPQLAEGQVVGGVVHGLGNALFEHMAYDENGQPLNTNFGDYLLPTAPEVPPIRVIFAPSPSPLNELGVKGVGECSTIAVPAAVVGAVEDALWSRGVRISEFPLTPMRVAELLGHGRAPAKNDEDGL